MIQILMGLALSLGSWAYEGQPKEITVISGPATKVNMQLPQITAEGLLIDDAKCSETTCPKLARVKGNVRIQAGEVEYKMLFVFVDINRQGQIIQPMKARAVIFSEVETGTRLTFALGEDRRTACFGASSSSNLCSFYDVKSTY